MSRRSSVESFVNRSSACGENKLKASALAEVPQHGQAWLWTLITGLYNKKLLSEINLEKMITSAICNNN